MICSVQFFPVSPVYFSHKKVYTLLDRDNTKAEFSFLHRRAYTFLDNATAVSELQFNVDRYSCR